MDPTIIVSCSTETGTGKCPCTESRASNRASASGSPRSFTATTSTSWGDFIAARRKARPVRPNPLIATLTAIVVISIASGGHAAPPAFDGPIGPWCAVVPKVPDQAPAVTAGLGTSRHRGRRARPRRDLWLYSPRGGRGRLEAMFEVRFHGRGGQGAVTAADLLALAAFEEGRHAQSFPSFGSERMGAPVVAYCRLGEREIRTREPVVAPDCLDRHRPHAGPPGRPLRRAAARTATSWSTPRGRSTSSDWGPCAAGSGPSACSRCPPPRWRCARSAGRCPTRRCSAASPP